MSFWKWSRTAANNATADGSINWAEGQAPSSVNNSARAMMAAAAKYRDDVAGAIATGGTSTAYTLTSNQVFDTLANMNGAMVAFQAHVTNGATPTLNVDGLGAKAINSASGTAIPAGTLVAGTTYAATYFNASNQWILHGFYGRPYDVPLGVALPFFGTAVPNSSFAFPAGQAISRTTYATLFSMIGTTFGAGDGSTTFNLPGLGGRLLACRENMNGAGAEGRITSAGSGIDGATLGATGGAQTVTLATGEIPSHSHANTLTDGGHAHGNTLSDGGHAHGNTLTDPGHTHLNNAGATFNGGLTSLVATATSGIGQQAGIVANTTGISINNASATTGIGINNASATTGISINNVAAGGGAAHNNMPPAMICNFIMRII